MTKVRLGTRGSVLARVQADAVAALLTEGLGLEVELVEVVTAGDRRPPDVVPGEGMFVAAIAEALLAGEIDVAVHSAKDVPLEEPEGLSIVAYPERADPRDVLATARGGARLDGLPAGARVGTDSPRRAGFLRSRRPDLDIVPLHGNVDTRLRRLDAGEVDGLVIAAAGIDRLGLGERADERLDPALVAPAPGQGALALQARTTDRSLVARLAALDRPEVHVAVAAERAVLGATGGGCRSPVGALALVDENWIELTAGAVAEDGGGVRWRRARFRADVRSALEEGGGVGRALAIGAAK
jgi:hydroxymethylbilane synthase